MKDKLCDACGHKSFHRVPHHHQACHCMPTFMTVEEEVKMLERAKEALEKQLKAINERIEKLKA